MKVSSCKFNKLLWHQSVFIVESHALSICGWWELLGRVKHYHSGQLFTADKPNCCSMVPALVTATAVIHELLEHLLTFLTWDLHYYTHSGILQRLEKDYKVLILLVCIDSLRLTLFCDVFFFYVLDLIQSPYTGNSL